ncbi:hypothetical protein ABT340_14920 [Streptosporangium sp. NPDC000239]
MADVPAVSQDIDVGKGTVGRRHNIVTDMGTATACCGCSVVTMVNGELE